MWPGPDEFNSKYLNNDAKYYHMDIFKHVIQVERASGVQHINVH